MSNPFVQIHEIEHQYPCYVDIRAIVSVDEVLQLITFYNKTTLQLTPEAFERVKEALKREEMGLNETEGTNRLKLSSV